MQQTLLI